MRRKKNKKKRKKRKKTRQHRKGEVRGLNSALPSKFQVLDEDDDEGIELVQHSNADGDDESDGIFDVSELDQLRMLEEYRESLGHEIDDAEEGVLAVRDGEHNATGSFNEGVLT